MSRSLRIVFMGTPGFAVASLDKIHTSDHEVVAVITAPDRPAGRGRKLATSEVKDYALEAEIPILQPLKLKDTAFISELRTYEADLFIVVAFRMLPEVVWSMPPLGTINLHGSLLPQYRGAAPINWAIVNGDTKTGVTTFYINEEIDQGKLIDSREVDIYPDDTAGSLHDRLMGVGAALLLDTTDQIAAGTAKAQLQDTRNEELRAAPKLDHENRTIDWNSDADDIRNLVRGLCPYPSAITTLYNSDQGKIPAKIHSIEVAEEGLLDPGSIATDNRSYIRVGSGSKDLLIGEIQLSGKRRMEVKSLLNGYKLELGAEFSS